MAESADILGKPSQRVVLPDLGAGCSMADMATIDQVEDAWEQLREIGVLDNKVALITYMNSSAAIKAFADVTKASSAHRRMRCRCLISI